MSGEIARPLSWGASIAAPPRLDLGQLRQDETAAVGRNPRLPMIGVERHPQFAWEGEGTWDTLASGQSVWRLALRSEGAQGIRIQFSNFHLDHGNVWIYAADRSQSAGPYSGAGIDGSGSFWSNTIFSDSVVVEYETDRPSDAPPFTIAGIAHLNAVEQLMSAGACELDVSCYATWTSVGASVGLYIFESGGATYACSGSLVNNTNNDAKPYFLTAGHCISSAAAASTAEVYWKDQTSTCNGTPPSLSSLPTSLGATYLASGTIEAGDYSLIRLSSIPNINLVFLGWNASTSVLPLSSTTGGTPTSAAVTGIHHPQADYTRISFGVRTPDAAEQIGTDIAPAAMYYQIQETQGRVEPGSSGSPLFTSDQLIVATLTYAPSGNACSISPFTAGYARFSVAYPQLSQYLAPAGGSTVGSSSGTGSGNSGSSPAPAVSVSVSPTALTAAWTTGAAAPSMQTVTLTTTASAATVFSLKASQTWITLSAASASAAQGKPATFGVTYNTQAFSVAGTYSGTISVSAGSASASVGVTVVVSAPAPVSGGPIIVVPFVADGGGVSTTLTILNPHATATNASIAFFSGNGTPLLVPVGASTAAWQNLVLPANGATVVVTSGTSSPAKQGFAVLQSGDATKKLAIMAQVGADEVAPSATLAPPFVIPFDATSGATTTAYFYNPGASGSVTLPLAIYDNTGKALGSGQITIPAGQQGAIPMSKSAAGFGGSKGTLVVGGSGSVLALGLRVGTDGRIEMVPVQAVNAP
ncbi:MAG: hypothetical protein ACLQVN_15845 [Bryobacteraceae bacterium]